MTNILIFIGTALTTASFVPYLRDIIRHGARPRLVSWVIWSLLLGLMTVVSVEEKQWASALVAGVSAFGCLAVVALGLRYASRHVTRLERVTLVGALLGIALWFVVDSPLVVMMIALAVDALAYIPTFIHGWQEPEEESVLAFACAGVGEAIILVAVWMQHAPLLGMLYPFYAGVFSLAMVATIYASRFWYGTGDIEAAEAQYTV